VSQPRRYEALSVEELNQLRETIRQNLKTWERQHAQGLLSLCDVEAELVIKGEVVTLVIGRH
jgi:hypothetical protein